MTKYKQHQLWWDIPAPLVTVVSSQAPPFLWEAVAMTTLHYAAAHERLFSD